MGDIKTSELAEEGTSRQAHWLKGVIKTSESAEEGAEEGASRLAYRLMGDIKTSTLA